MTLAAPSLVGVACVLKVAGRDAGHGGALALSELPPVALTRCCVLACGVGAVAEVGGGWGWRCLSP